MLNISFENAKINQDNDENMTERREKKIQNAQAHVNSSISIDRYMRDAVSCG